MRTLTDANFELTRLKLARHFAGQSIEVEQVDAVLTEDHRTVFFYTYFVGDVIPFSSAATCRRQSARGPSIARRSPKRCSRCPLRALIDDRSDAVTCAISGPRLAHFPSRSLAIVLHSQREQVRFRGRCS
jgi:hypothetical protein